MKTLKRKIGDLGENIAAEFLEKQGYKILDRNYLRKWGELDIVAKYKGKIHFIEVKSATWNVPHVTIRPEENMHPGKIMRLHRAIQTYLIEKGIEGDFELDLVTVCMDERTRQARVELLENII